MTPIEERRAFAQILIDEIGAAGPETAEETAQRAVELIRQMKADGFAFVRMRALFADMAEWTDKPRLPWKSGGVL
jgi:hypothetical protein